MSYSLIILSRHHPYEESFAEVPKEAREEMVLYSFQKLSVSLSFPFQNMSILEETNYVATGSKKSQASG